MCRPISASKLLQGDCMEVQTTKPANSLRQRWKEQDGTCPASSNHFWCLLFSVLDRPNLPLPTLFGGPNSSLKHFSQGPEKCDQIPPRPQKEHKMQIGGLRKRFRGARKVARKMETLHLRTEFLQETLPHNACQTLTVKGSENCFLNANVCTYLEDVALPPKKYRQS